MIKQSEILEKIGKEFYGEKFNLDNQDLFFCYKKAFEIILTRSEKINSKGFMIIGGIGVGKSAMVKIMQNFFKDSDSKFKWVNAYKLKDLSEAFTSLEIKESYGYGFKGDLYIDDIGLTTDVKRYGNTINIISEIILERYDLFISSKIKTHFSSNLPAHSKDENVQTLIKTYGSRVVDRMKEMCEIINFNGESKRI